METVKTGTFRQAWALKEAAAAFDQAAAAASSDDLCAHFRDLSQDLLRWAERIERSSRKAAVDSESVAA
jgi:hypothetical protein